MTTGVWATADVISATRMNEKTIFQGTGSAINSLAVTYPGMFAFCTSTGSGFTVDVLYERNAANSTWNPVSLDQSPYLTLSTTIGDYTSPNAAVSSSDGTITPTYSDDFSGADNWVDNDSAKIGVNTGTDVLDFNGVMDSTSDKSVYDLTSTSDTAWVLRFRINFSTLTTSTNNLFFIYLSSVNQASSITAVQDALGLRLFYSAGTKAFETVDTDGASFDVAPDNSTAWTPSTSTNYYVEIKRTSSTAYSVQIFTNSDYSTGSLGTATGTCASTCTGLRYLSVSNYSAVTEGGVQQGVIDDIAFYNGVTAATYLASFIYDGSTSTFWQSTSEANPKIYVDLSGSAREVVGIALNINKTNTTVTSLKIRGSTDTTFTDPENIIYVNISDFTDDTWRFMANNFLGTNVRYIQVYANETGVLSLNEIKIRYGVSDLVKILTHKHRTRNTSAADGFVDSN